jgi:hypothetical protein
VQRQSWTTRRYDDTVSIAQLDFVLKVAQLVFYTSGILVAWLTYRSARRGLLNTVNTEYQKRVIERLAEVSAGLWAEFDREGESLFYQFTCEVRDRVPKINAAWRDGERSESFAARMMIGGKTEFVGHLFDFATKSDSDPFLPAYIRNEVVTFLRDRAWATWNVTTEQLEAYRQALDSGDLQPEDVHATRIRDTVLNNLETRGFALPQATEEIVRLRNLIQAHLESYDPLRHTKPPALTRQLRKLE